MKNDDPAALPERLAVQDRRRADQHGASNPKERGPENRLHLIHRRAMAKGSPTSVQANVVPERFDPIDLARIDEHYATTGSHGNSWVAR